MDKYSMVYLYDRIYVSVQQNDLDLFFYQPDWLPERSCVGGNCCKAVSLLLIDVAKNNTSSIDTYVFVKSLKLNESSKFMVVTAFQEGGHDKKGALTEALLFYERLLSPPWPAVGCHLGGD